MTAARLKRLQRLEARVPRDDGGTGQEDDEADA
jgi:hypothetical protein